MAIAWACGSPDSAAWRRTRLPSLNSLKHISAITETPQSICHSSIVIGSLWQQQACKGLSSRRVSVSITASLSLSLALSLAHSLPNPMSPQQHCNLQHVVVNPGSEVSWDFCGQTFTNAWIQGFILTSCNLSRACQPKVSTRDF